MAIGSYTGDFNYSTYTPPDNTGYYDIFRSGYKNIRFNIQPNSKVTLDDSTAYNLPGIAYAAFGDSSLWRGLLAYNGLNDPLTDVYPGLSLAIPTKSDIVAYISKQTANNSQAITI
jgi:hypothetical protein